MYENWNISIKSKRMVCAAVCKRTAKNEQNSTK